MMVACTRTVAERKWKVNDFSLYISSQFELLLESKSEISDLISRPMFYKHVLGQTFGKVWIKQLSLL